MCQDENGHEPEDESFRSFWIKPVTNEPRPQYYDFFLETRPGKRSPGIAFMLKPMAQNSISLYSDSNVHCKKSYFTFVKSIFKY